MLATRTESPRSVARRAREAIRRGPISATVLSALVVAVGCGLSGGGSAETDSGTGSGTSETTGESETGAPVDCASFTDEADCLAAGCAGVVAALRFLDDADCDSRVSSEVCVPPGPVWDGVPTAYHRVVDGARVFVSVEPCDADEGPVVVPGQGWSECSGGAEDPDECACLCAHGTCAGEWQRDAMLACNLPEPCAALEINGWGAEWENAAACVLDAASTAARAHLTITGDWGDPYEASHVFLLGDGTALWNRYAGDHSCLGCGCGQGFAPSLDLCTLEAPPVFAACKASPSTEPDGCLSPGQWFSSCEPAEPACPVCPQYEYFTCDAQACMAPTDPAEYDVCGASNLFDADGCMRKRCAADRDCSAGETCYSTIDCFPRACVASTYACQPAADSACECLVSGDCASAEAIRWCVAAEEVPC